MKECLLLAVEELYETPSYLWLPGVAGPKFDIATKEVAAVILEYEASTSFSYHYDTMRDFYTEVQTWFQARLQDAPPGLKSGFFVSYLGKLRYNWECCLLCKSLFEMLTTLSTRPGHEPSQRHFAKWVTPGCDAAVQSSMTCSAVCWRAAGGRWAWQCWPACWCWAWPPAAPC